MPPRTSYDVAIIGGGIVGVAAALSLVQQHSLSVCIIETENELAFHQTGHNSGVIHSGLYYKPGSRKARNCTEGRDLMYDYCERNGIAHERCGKIVVASSDEEIAMLDTLYERGSANGLTGIKKLTREELHEYEPHVAGLRGLFVPQTGIVHYPDVVRSFAELVRNHGGDIRTGTKFTGITAKNGILTLETTGGEIQSRSLINCAGLHCDDVARLCGIDVDIRIVPFRGEYYELKKEKQYLVRNLIYPVPDPRYPFLGVHFTRMIRGGVEAGPNAVLALKKEGYSKTDISFGDVVAMIAFPGFWKMARQHYRMGFEEFRRSFSKQLFVRALQKLVPEITENDVVPSGSGVRAQALDRNGKLLDDFYIKETDRMIHVLNAPSPAATASLSIGRTIGSMAASRLQR
jgi:L-2-hydroxyglutarate oxidase